MDSSTNASGMSVAPIEASFRSETPETIELTPDQQALYDSTFAALNEASEFLNTLIPSVVSLEPVRVPSSAGTTSPPTPMMAANHSHNDSSTNSASSALFSESTLSTLTSTAGRGHTELLRALEVLEGLEKEEQSLVYQTSLTRFLTELLTGEAYGDSRQAIASLEALGCTVPRRVCQHPFKKNDIVWVCRTCQADETCVLCHSCFSQSSHEGHDVAFYHAQAGGCCDCGDPDAWDPKGFCPRHGPDANVSGLNDDDSNGTSLPDRFVHRVRGVVPACVDWMVQMIAANAEKAYARANPPTKRRMMLSNKDRLPFSAVPLNHSESASDALTDADDGMLLFNANNSDIINDILVDEYDFILEESFPRTHHPLHRSHVFSPNAASNSQSLPQQQQQIEASVAAEALGHVGRAGHGLYLVIHADDIHSIQQLHDALKDFLGTANYYADTLLGKLARALRMYGQLVVWGTTELIQEVGITQVHLWMDGDKVATGRIGGIVLERAGRLRHHGMFCSILTRDELILEQRAVAVLQWLSFVARSCDPLCLTVAECILPNRHLVPLLLADFKMSARVTKAWYSLLLTLLAVPTFKSHLAAAYCDTYRAVTAKYARGMGVLERSGYTLSVQFLNRVTYVLDLVQGRDLLGKLGKSLLETLTVAARSPYLNGRLDPNHFVLTHRRYSPCISDFKCVLNVDGMSRVIAARGGTFLGDWVSTLSLAQFMDSHVWRHWAQGHVEDESRGWVGAFNLSISLGSLFERILCWTDDATSPISEGPLSGDLMSCVELTLHILVTGIDPWQRSEMLLYRSTPADVIQLLPHTHASASLPFSTVASLHGSALAMTQLPVSLVSPFSFHLPLHRFVASCLRELCMRRDTESGDIAELLHRLRAHISKEQNDYLFQGLMEFPVLVLTRAAQIRAGLWRRNGSGLNDQVLNYSEPPFCRNMRDADLLMTQFATLGRTLHQSADARPSSDVGMAFLVNLMLHRLGLFQFVGFAEAPTGNVAGYLQGITDGLYPEEQKDNSSDVPLPVTFVHSRDSASFMLLLEEFLHFFVIFIVELPSFVAYDKEGQTQQAKLRLYREVVHRLASGPKPHSEVSEVHHVLSHWDNFLLSEDGKMVNPDDATGAALAAVLDEIANRKVSRGKMEPDKWELKQEAWDAYDPAFFHISLRSHQTAAAEGRPKPPEDTNAPFGWVAKPYAPVPVAAHPLFERLRRDATADVTILSVAYRVLHLHCRGASNKSIVDLRGRLPYENSEKSETALARTIHLLTLGAYAWNEKSNMDSDWRNRGGGSVGSIFFNEPDDFIPNAGSWVKAFLLAEPERFLDCEWYEGEAKALILLEKLAVGNGADGGFVAQDSSVRSGAAWLCEFALSCCPEASEVLTPVSKTASQSGAHDSSKNSDMEMRKKAARAKAMARMQAQAAKFSAMLDADVASEDESEHNAAQDMSTSAPSTPGSPNRPVRKASFGSTFSSGSSLAMGESGNGAPPFSIDFPDANEEDSHIPPRLLQNRPRCIICNDEDGVEGRIIDKPDNDDGEGQRKKSRRRTENALGFVGYAQASVVLKGGGGPPPELSSKFSAVCEFVGTHVALCGHAVHSECCESYLATVSHREDRQIGKRDEFRCPLCQRLSNCLVPFIDAGMDWIEAPSHPLGDTVKESSCSPKSDDDMEWNDEHVFNPSLLLQSYLESTPWWVTRRSRSVAWDGHSAFVDRGAPVLGDESITVRKSSRIRSLRKKDLYQAWNAMMHTPRFVRRKLCRSISRAPISETDSRATSLTTGEDSTGETIVWRRFMDQISDISYRADSKRLGDDHLHDLFGEFRHYIVERYAYSTRNGLGGGESSDWPSCLFTEPLSEQKRQEMSREKLMSKLLLSIQAFTYSCCSEAFEAKRAYRKCSLAAAEVAKKGPDSSIESVLSRFGLRGLVCHGKMILLPQPSPQEDSDSWPFSGRLGKLRYLGLAVMAASGAVAADLVQLVLPFPAVEHEADLAGVAIENPKRAPIAYPLLFSNILTHVVAAMCATCGRARARSDLLDVVWPIPFSIRGSFAFLDLDGNAKTVDSVVQDCEGFLKLGLIARMLQVLLGTLCSASNMTVISSSWIETLKNILATANNKSTVNVDVVWMSSCVQLLEVAVSGLVSKSVATEPAGLFHLSLETLQEACSLAALAAGSFLIEAGTIYQILVPGAVARYDNVLADHETTENPDSTPLATLQEALSFFRFESVDQMIGSELMKEIVVYWFDAAFDHTKLSVGHDEASSALFSRLYRTQGFRVYDWPSAKPLDYNMDTIIREWSDKDLNKARLGMQPQDEAASASDLLPVESLEARNTPASTADVVRSEVSPSLLTFQSKKCVSLLGGFSPDHFMTSSKLNARPRVCVIPTSYTDLYAELASLLPDCEQTAVCLICGEVLNAGGRGECTRHSFKCGAGAGIFFLLQECSGLILHKARAAYIHSPYVDSHGETPQYRGRPLNLDLDRYEHLREVWFSHGVRQKVLTERAMARQVILPDFY